MEKILSFIWSAIKFCFKIAFSKQLWEVLLYFFFFCSATTVINIASDGYWFLAGAVSFMITSAVYNLNVLCQQSLKRLHTIEQLLRQHRTGYIYGKDNDEDAA
jgi:hypothetical protein